MDFELSFLNIQGDFLANVKNKALILAGNGRCDYPDKFAKFYIYSMIDIIQE